MLLDNPRSNAYSSCEIEIVSTVPCHNRNYLRDDDISFTRAYIHVSTDTIAESNIVRETYYKRIWQVYKTMNFSNAFDFALSFVQMLMKLVFKKSLQLADCFKTEKSLRKSEHTKNKEVNLAIVMFLKPTVPQQREYIGRAFRFFGFVVCCSTCLNSKRPARQLQIALRWKLSTRQVTISAMKKPNRTLKRKFCQIENP